MQKIIILDPHEAIKIAAGEVVERPAHILKELIENSIDAAATEISIHVAKAGKESLAITDNGHGMSSIDARLCFIHHATSKITCLQDLQTITTHGFRGEALTSIAAVATVELTTKTDLEKSATHIIMAFGNLQKEDLVAHPTGTTICVSKLFDQIPARKKFLKSDETEWHAIVTIVQAFCLRYTHIHFKLFHNNHLFYNCPKTTNIIDRCVQLWHTQLHDKLITIPPTTKQHITLHGATSKPDYFRYNRNQVFIFVNNRWVKNIELFRAIMKGYQQVLPAQKYPATILAIELSNDLVDSNIHPKKEEVKFLHSGIVQNVIQETISQALQTSLLPTTTHKQNQNFMQSEPVFLPQQPTLPKINQVNIPISEPTCMPNFLATPYDFSKQSHKQQIQEKIIKLPRNLAFEEPIATEKIETFYKEKTYTLVGQFAATYIVIEHDNNLALIDQHAAHERIVYEAIKKDFAPVATIALLFPHIMKLSATDLALIAQHLDLFAKHGIILEPLSETELILQATPVALQNKAIADIVHTTLAWIKEQSFVNHDDFFKALHESLITQRACKTAVKAGDILNSEQMNNIVETLLTTENRFCCPHGRPTLWQLSEKDIEKKFKRDYKAKSSDLSF